MPNPEPSWPWALGRPLKAAAAKDELDLLRMGCTKAQQGMRRTAFPKAQRFIEHAEANGGIDYPVRVSFHDRAVQSKYRVDIEVHSGRAFVP